VSRHINSDVTFFDICSSSKITEDLSQNDELAIWRKTLKSVEKKLDNKSKDLGFSVYKFLGDGWILIIEPKTNKKLLLDFFASLCNMYLSYFRNNIEKRLSTTVESIGLTFGLDIGNIYSIKISGKDEFMGPPLNIAARLQSSIVSPNIRDDNPSNQLMMIRRNYIRHFQPFLKGKYVAIKAERTLKNIRNDDTFFCTRIWLHEPFRKDKILNRPLSSFHLSSRVHNVMLAANIKTINDLSRFNEEEMLRFRKIWTKEINELKSLLGNFGL